MKIKNLFYKINRNFIFTLIILIVSIFFVSCDTEITLTLQKDDSVEIRFEGGAGEAFSKMINSATGGTGSDLLIDTSVVSYELAMAGFENVNVQQKPNGAVLISMKDRKQTSYVFTSKIIKAEKGKLTTSITPKSLEDFYKSSDEQTRMILDLFLAPVFNDEEMSEEEYTQMVASFYGEAAAREIKQSIVKINLISKDGEKESLRIPLVQLLCGNM